MSSSWGRNPPPWGVPAPAVPPMSTSVCWGVMGGETEEELLLGGNLMTSVSLPRTLVGSLELVMVADAGADLGVVGGTEVVVTPPTPGSRDPVAAEES